MHFFRFKSSTFLLFCFLFFSLSSNSYAEFTPLPKRKKHLNSVIDQPRKIIEMHKENSLDKDVPIPKRKKNIHTYKPIEKKELKNKVENLNDRNDKLITAEITNLIRNKLTKCWNITDNLAYEKGFNIKINILLSTQGEVVMTDIADSKSYRENSLFRSVADSAMRAIYKCSPFNLPKEHYHIWREIILDFIL